MDLCACLYPGQKVPVLMAFFLLIYSSILEVRKFVLCPVLQVFPPSLLFIFRFLVTLFFVCVINAIPLPLWFLGFASCIERALRTKNAGFLEVCSDGAGLRALPPSAQYPSPRGPAEP